MKALIKAPELFGVPAYEWLDGKGKITKRFAAFSARVSAGYKGGCGRPHGRAEAGNRRAGNGQMIKLDFDSGRL